MKELFVAFSKYNQKTNQIIMGKLAQMNHEQIRNEIKAYYATVADTLFHVMSSDRKWLTRLSKYFKSSEIQGELSEFKDNEKMNLNKVINNITKFIDIRSKMDHDIVQIIKAIPENDFKTEIEIPWGSGTITKPLWKLLFQWFNHQTHHRGQISLQMEIVGIENDFSLVLDKIE